MRDSRFINYNGKIIGAGENIFHLNRAMNYGDGLFESIRLHQGEILFLHEHLERMFNGMKALKMSVPDHFSPFFFHKQLIELAQREQPGANARMRIAVFRGGGGLYEPQSQTTEYFMQVMPLDRGYVWSDAACELGIFKEVPKNYSVISFFKSMNALPYVLAGIYRKEHHLDDCLLLNSFGSVADAISSNVFWVQGKTYYTSPLTDGAIDGVMRRKIIQLIKYSDIIFSENSISPDDLLQADEIFLTNAGWGMKSVTKFGEKKYGSYQTKHLFQLLMHHISA
jgi:branched-subunit amino acid aminotransferase/4-amino-4-deoxychorismate lyase